MQYFGGKSKVSKEIAEKINNELIPNQTFVDLFCGSCNIISKINANRIRIANDKHKYLIEMFKGLQNGETLPDDVSEETYKYIKTNKDENKFLTGFIGFSCSFSGKWFGGYARNSRGDNFCAQSKKSLLRKFENLKNVKFINEDFYNVDIPNGSLVYCDIPYKNSTPYAKDEVGIFNHEIFYDWVRKNRFNFTVYVSEYVENIPNDFEPIWKFESNKEIRNYRNERIKTIETLSKLKQK